MNFMDKEQIAIYSIIGSLLIASITIIGNVVVTIISKRNEFKQAQFKTIMECAWKEYEYKTNLVNEKADKEGKEKIIVPFIEYLIFYSVFLKVLSRHNIKEQHIKAALKEKKDVTDNYYKYYGDYKTNRHPG